MEQTTATSITILGSTGSIGTQTLEVVEHLKGRFQVCGLAARSRIQKLAEQIHQFKPHLTAVFLKEKSEELKGLLEGLRTEVLSGADGVEEVAGDPEADIVVSAMTGAAGLRPILRAIDAGKTVAIANKEPLVTAGNLIMNRARETGAQVLPIDSEHSAIFQCIRHHEGCEVEKITLTASGGPFRETPIEQFPNITPEEALKHPTWNMGKKVTIDSATLMNKGLELIEAKWLFGLSLDQIEVVIHPQSIVHSLVHFVDGSVLAQLGNSDMRLPIQYALTYPRRLPNKFPRLNLTEVGCLNFYEPCEEKFPAISLCRKAVETGGTAPAALNAANEETVNAFLERKIRLDQIMEVNRRVLEGHQSRSQPDLETTLEADEEARREAREIISTF